MNLNKDTNVNHFAKFERKRQDDLCCYRYKHDEEKKRKMQRALKTAPAPPTIPLLPSHSNVCLLIFFYLNTDGRPTILFKGLIFVYLCAHRYRVLYDIFITDYFHFLVVDIVYHIRTCGFLAAFLYRNGTV